MPLKLAAGVNSMFVPLITTVPPTAFDTAVIVSVWPVSFAGPAASLPSSEAKLMIRVPLSSATLDSDSSPATGASLTAVTANDTLPVSVLKSSTPLVGPLSWTV